MDYKNIVYKKTLVKKILTKEDFEKGKHGEFKIQTRFGYGSIGSDNLKIPYDYGSLSELAKNIPSKFIDYSGKKFEIRDAIMKGTYVALCEIISSIDEVVSTEFAKEIVNKYATKFSGTMRGLLHEGKRERFEKNPESFSKDNDWKKDFEALDLFLGKKS